MSLYRITLIFLLFDAIFAFYFNRPVQSITSNNRGYNSRFAALMIGKENDIRIFVSGLKKLAQKRRPLSESELEYIEDVIQATAKSSLLDPSNAATILWSIGSLKLRFANVEDVCGKLLRALNSDMQMISTSDFSTALLGVAKIESRSSSDGMLDSSLSSLPGRGSGVSSFKAQLLKDSFIAGDISRMIYRLDAQQLSNCVWSLGKLRFDVFMSDATLSALLHAVGDRVSSMTAHALVNTMYGLSHLGMSWSGMPASVRNALTLAVQERSVDMREHEATVCISSLGRLRTSWGDLPTGTRAALGNTIMRISSSMGPKGLTMTVHGLGHMNIHLQTTPMLKLETVLLRSVIALAPCLNAQEVSNVLYGLGKMGVQFVFLRGKLNKQGESDLCGGGPWARECPLGPLDMDDIVGVASDEVAVKMAEEEVLHGKLTDVRSSNGGKSILQKCDNVAGAWGDEYYCYFVQDIAKGDLNFTSWLRARAVNEVVCSFNALAPRMAAQGISSSLWGFMLLGIRWADLAPATQRAIIRAMLKEVARMDEQAVANCIFALGSLGIAGTCVGAAAGQKDPATTSEMSRARNIRLNRLPAALKDGLLAALERTCGEMPIRGLTMSLLGLSKLQLPFAAFSKDLNRAILDAAVRHIDNANSPRPRPLHACYSGSGEGRYGSVQGDSGDGLDAECELNEETENAMSALAHAFAAVGAKWNDLTASPALRDAMLLALSQYDNSMTALEGAPDAASCYDDTSMGRAPSTEYMSTSSGKGFARVSSSYTCHAPAKRKSEKASGRPRAKRNITPDSRRGRRELSLRSLLDVSPSAAVSMLFAGQTGISATSHPRSRTGGMTPVRPTYRRMPKKPLLYKDESGPRGRTGSMASRSQPSIGGVNAEVEMSEEDFTPNTLAPRPNETEEGARSSAVFKSPKRTLVVNMRPVGRAVAQTENNRGIALSRGASPLVYSLGQMGAKWDELGVAVRSALMRGLCTSLADLDESGVVNSIHGLTNVGAKWSDLSDDLKLSLQKALLRVSTEMGEQGVAVAVLSLAKLDVSWSLDLLDETKVALRTAITRQSHLGEHALSSLLYGFGKMSRRWNELNANVRDALKVAIVVCHLNDRCTPQGVANSLYGLSKMEVVWSSLSSSVQLALTTEVTKALGTAESARGPDSAGLSLTQLTSILGSLGAMGCRWSALPEQTRGLILSRLLKYSPDMNDRHVATVLHAFNALEACSWYSMDAALRDELTARVLHLLGADRRWQLKTKQLVNIRGETANSASISDSNSGFEHKRQRMPKMMLSPPPLGSVPPMTSQSFCSIFLGLSKLGASWAILPLPVISAFEFSLERLLRGSSYPSIAPASSAQLATIMATFLRGTWRWEALGEPLQRELLSSIARTLQSPQCTSSEASLIIHGMGGMGLRWEVDLHIGASGVGATGLSAAVVSGIVKVCSEGRPEEVGGLVLGLGLMECVWGKLAPGLRRVLKRGILRSMGADALSIPDTDMDDEITEHCVGDVSCGQEEKERRLLASGRSPRPQHQLTALLGADLDLDLDPLLAENTFRKASEKSLYDTTSPSSLQSLPSSSLSSSPSSRIANPQAVSNIMYALALLIFDCEEEDTHVDLIPVHIALLDSIRSVGIARFSDAEREQILIYLSLLETLVPEAASEALMPRQPAFVIRADKQPSKPSSLQQSVVCALANALRVRNAALEVADEFSSFQGALPVDATVFGENHDVPVAFVEVDGPQHYRSDGELRRKDVLKEALYKGKFPWASFTRVRFDQVNRLGSGFVASELAAFIALLYAHAPPEVKEGLRLHEQDAEEYGFCSASVPTTTGNSQASGDTSVASAATSEEAMHLGYDYGYKHYVRLPASISSAGEVAIGGHADYEGPGAAALKMRKEKRRSSQAVPEREVDREMAWVARRAQLDLRVALNANSPATNNNMTSDDRAARAVHTSSSTPWQWHQI